MNLTAKRFKYGSNERWECVLIDTLEKKEYDFCEVGKLCNRLWEQTQRFENHNKDLMEENKQLKQYKKAIFDCDSSKIIRVNKNTNEVDLVDKEIE